MDKRQGEHAQSVEGLIGEIRGLARTKLAADQIDSIVDEVRVHLDASIQARLELGMPLEQAEQEAVLAFGDTRAFARKISDTRKPITMFHGLTLGVLAAVSVAAFVAEANGSQHETSVELWTALSLLVPMVAAGLLGWRRKFNARRLLLGLCLSIPLAVSLVSCFYVVSPDTTEFLSRSDIARWIGDVPAPLWKNHEQAKLQEFVRAETLKIESTKPPYKLSTYVDTPNTPPFKVAHTKEEASRMLAGIKSRREHDLAVLEPSIEQSRRLFMEFASTPMPINCFRLLPFVLGKWAMISLLIGTSYALALFFRHTTGAEFRSKLLLRPVLELGLEDHRGAASSETEGLMVKPLFRSNPWIDLWVLAAALIFPPILLLASTVTTSLGAIYGTLSVLTVLISCMNWRVKRPQFLPMVACFLVGVPIFAYQPPPYHMWLAQGLGVSASVTLIFGGAGMLSWFFGSLWRNVRGATR